jgi:hypothetical protein
VPVSLPAVSPPANPRDIQIQLRRGATSWPLSAPAEFEAWMRELLR